MRTLPLIALLLAAQLAVPVAIYSSGAALDLASTESALARGANEGNPILRGSFEKRVAVKAALVAGVVILDSKVKSKPARWAIRLGWVAAHVLVARRNWRLR
jgi:hypothetical protein